MSDPSETRLDVRLVPMTDEKKQAIIRALGGTNHGEALAGWLDDAFDATPADPAEAVLRTIDESNYGPPLWRADDLTAVKYGVDDPDAAKVTALRDGLRFICGELIEEHKWTLDQIHRELEECSDETDADYLDWQRPDA